MKRVTVWIIAAAFAFSALTFAGDQVVKVRPKPEPAKVTTEKVVGMKATGKVVDVTDTSLKIERTVKGAVEPFEFALEKPLTKIKVGDKVIITYIIKDEKNVITRITKQGPKLIKKIVPPKEKMEPDILSTEVPAPVK
jgi:hypothetical protein